MTVRYRVEEDALGRVEIPFQAYYGAQTERARRNFAVSERTLGTQPGLVAAIAEVKKAAALANLDIGVLREPVAEAICQAADEIASGLLGPEEFPVDVLSAGGGASQNANLNEVIANRANELLSGRRGYEFVHPMNHVNAGQSTSDAMATAVNIALHRDLLALRDSVLYLADALEEKIEQYRDTIQFSRGYLESVPLTFGQAFGAYLAVARRGVNRLEDAADNCLEVPMGGTLGVGERYLTRIYPRLRETTGLALRRHQNFLDAFQNGDVFQYVSTIFKALACGLMKVAKDLRALSGEEIRLPTVQAGSVLTPGRVSPVMAELVVQVGFQVCGNDTVVTMAVEGAELDYNPWTAVIAKNLFESARLLTSTMPLFADKCLRGLEVDVEHSRNGGENSLGLSTVVESVYGHEAAARAAHHASSHHTSIRNSVVELGIAPSATADRLFDPRTLADPVRSARLLDDLVAEQRTATTELVHGLSENARRAIFHAAKAVAQADEDVNDQEQQALRVVAEALALEEIPESGPMDELTAAERGLVYATAAWLAGADSVTEVREAELLTRLERELNLGRSTAEVLQGKVDVLRLERGEYLPRSEQLPWWEEFGTLVRRLLVVTP